ncbi:unnamed protein product, partial [Ambrosiozyma monospora]
MKKSKHPSVSASTSTSTSKAGSPDHHHSVSGPGSLSRKSSTTFSKPNITGLSTTATSTAASGSDVSGAATPKTAEISMTKSTSNSSTSATSTSTVKKEKKDVVDSYSDEKVQKKRKFSDVVSSELTSNVKPTVHSSPSKVKASKDIKSLSVSKSSFNASVKLEKEKDQEKDKNHSDKARASSNSLDSKAKSKPSTDEPGKSNKHDTTEKKDGEKKHSKSIDLGHKKSRPTASLSAPITTSSSSEKEQRKLLKKKLKEEKKLKEKEHAKDGSVRKSKKVTTVDISHGEKKNDDVAPHHRKLSKPFIAKVDSSGSSTKKSSTEVDVGVKKDKSETKDSGAKVADDVSKVDK